MSMDKMKKLYLADMRSHRKMQCWDSVDPVWYQKQGHSSLKVFNYISYMGMDNMVMGNVLACNKPEYDGLSEELLVGVKESYGEEVLETVTSLADYKKKLAKLAGLMLPELREMLARQGRDYEIDEERFPPQLPVDQQADSINGVPTHNMAGERGHDL